MLLMTGSTVVNGMLQALILYLLPLILTTAQSTVKIYQLYIAINMLASLSSHICRKSVIL